MKNNDEQGLDKIRVALENVRFVTDELNNLAGAFEVVGNHRMDEILSKLAKLLYFSEKKINIGMSEKINQDFDLAQKSTNNMVKGILTGVELGKDSHGK